MKPTDSIDQIKGVGPKTSAILQRFGFFTINDLYYNLPRCYENYQAATKIADIKPGKVVVKGRISQINTRHARRRNLTITEAVITDDSDSIRAVWFNQAYRARSFQEGAEYYFSGEYCLKNGRYQLESPNTQLAASISSTALSGGLEPIYKSHGELNSHFFAKIMNFLRPNFANIPDLLPFSPAAPTFCAPGARREALFKIHFPNDSAEADQAREYLSYEELFELSLAAALNKNANHKLHAHPCPFVAENTRALIAKLDFPLTNAQRRASWEILQDLAKATPMNRLLQGDVGSGKTVVAAIAAFQAIRAGQQVALLAPTAILAKQHAESLATILSPLGVNCVLLTAASKHKKELKQHIADGSAELIIGTHAMLTDDTIFHSLALVIIDEQHRFGVEQRQKLLMKANKNQNSASACAPHLLAMTATPIPRSLQLAVFGDLELSVLNELPKGRQAISTKILNEPAMSESLYPAIRERLARHEQIYWICKAIDDPAKSPSSSSSNGETASVKKQSAKLQKIFPHATVAFLHGRMKAPDKDQIMADFAAGKIDILVSTTVVEVGVNVPNATSIVIMDAEQYGLAQLHQLRGRVGRGQKASDCYLITTGDHPPSRRLRELEKSTDGFHLAEVDLKLRGPGEIYGSLQHGALNLRIATLNNSQLIASASRHAKTFAAELAKNPSLMLKYNELAQNITKYQQLTTLN